MRASTRRLVLVIDDREDITAFCRRSLHEAYDFQHVTSARAAGDVLRRHSVDAVLLDRDFSHVPASDRLGPADDARNEGLHVLRWLREEHPTLPVIMVTGLRETSVAVQAAELRADFVAWDDVLAEPGVLAARLQRAIEQGRGGTKGHAQKFRELGLVAESPALCRALEVLWRALPGDSPILLLGETGTGKGELAQAVHRLSGGASRPFLHLDVTTLNPNLVEAELFGHAKGVYTDAHQARIGKLRAAHGGTLFLDEICNLAPELQAKLLIALERREVVPVGEVHAQPAEFRLVTATSRDLRALVNGGLFRRDLYHRIAWHLVEIPPLRERPEDVPALAEAFLRSTPQYADASVTGFARETIDHLASLPWVGNVRELRAVVAAAAAEAARQVTVRDVLEVVHRHEAPTTFDAAAPPSAAAAEGAVFGDRTYRELTGAYFRYLLAKSGGRLAEVARRAGISKATAYEWKYRFESTSERGQPRLLPGAPGPPPPGPGA